MQEPPVILRLAAFELEDGSVQWVLWIEHDRESDRLDRLYAGRVKLQDDPIATAHCVLYDAVEKLQTALGAVQTPLPF